MAKATTTIPLISLVNKFDVRTALDDDRVVQMAGILQAGGEFPPIEVVPLGGDKYAYVDGRHRAAAYMMRGRREIEAYVLSAKLLNDPVGLLARALHANYGGAKPPTRADMAHTVLRMMEAGAKQMAVREQLGAFLPAATVNMLIQDARSTLLKRKVAAALRDLAGGYSLQEAATRQGVTVEQVKAKLTGKGVGLGGSPEKRLEISYKAHAVNTLKSARVAMQKKLEHALKQVDEGDLPAKSAAAIMDEWEDKLKDLLDRLIDWRGRLDAIEKSQDKASGANVA